MSKKPNTPEIIIPTSEVVPEVPEITPEPKPEKSQNIKVEVSTEKLENVFNDGFKQLGKLLKPEPAKPETPPAPIIENPAPAPAPKKSALDDYNELMGF